MKKHNNETKENADNIDNNNHTDNIDNNNHTDNTGDTENTSNQVDIGRMTTMKYLKMLGILLIVCVTLVGALLFAVNRLSLSFFYVSGDSMEPTLYDGDVAVLNFKDGISTGDTVFFRTPSKWSDYAPGLEEQTIFVKNITVLPYQELTINKDGYYVNGEKKLDFEEANYTCKAAEEREEPYSHVLGLHQIFVTGDNATKSLDSLRIYCENGEEDMYLSKMEVMQHGEIIKVI